MVAEVVVQKSIPVFKALFNDELMAWGLTEECVRATLKTHWAFDEPAEGGKGTQWATEDDSDGWRIIREEEVVYVVSGTLRDWNDPEEGEPLLHVHWTCPQCGVEQTCDVAPSDRPPGLWGCGAGKCRESVLSFVSW